MAYVIFAIDNNNDTHAVAKFMRHIDTKRVMGEMKGEMVHAIGYWEGILEPSYIMHEDDYRDHVLPMGFTEEQDAVMMAPANRAQPAYLVDYDLTGFQVSLNPIKEVTAEEAKAAIGWTYNQQTGKHFVA
jgi:hypothetical protein